MLGEDVKSCDDGDFFWLGLADGRRWCCTGCEYVCTLGDDILSSTTLDGRARHKTFPHLWRPDRSTLNSVQTFQGSTKNTKSANNPLLIIHTYNEP